MSARFALVCVGLAIVAGLALAQEPPTTGGTTPLGIRQQRVERMMEDLERKFKSLKLALQENEPERAERLQQTLDRAKELLLQKRMSDITKLLDQAQLDTATDGQKAVLADILALLELLLDEKSDRDKIREEYERLSQWKAEIEDLIKAERGEKRESDRLANKDQALADLQEKIKALEAVIARQKEIVEATQSARTEGIQGLGKIAADQAANRQQAKAIANQISKEAGDEKEPYESQPAPPMGGDAAAGRPADGGAGAEGAPGSSAPSEDTEEGAASQLQPPPPNIRPPEPGEKPLAEAIENQRAAEGNLQEGKGKAAQQDEETAVTNLQRALAELKRESQRIASLPPEAFEKMAGKQDDIANQTGQLERKMQEAGQPAGGEGGQGGGQGAGGKPQPGQQQVQQAQKSMKQASGGLRKQDPGDASRQQGKAIRELEEALREIEERLAQLREETQLEKLARLEARFREMLSIQQRLTQQTAALDKKRTDAGGQLARTDRNVVRAIGDDERRMDVVRGEAESKGPGLAGMAQQALDIIVDDGTSVVFPDVVANLRDDLLNVGNLLVDNLRTDHYTQTLQQEIETTLEELIEALQQAQQQREGSGGGGGGGGMEPLLPNSAELKLLRSAQLRINRRTVALDRTKGESGALDESLKGDLQTIANRQAEIAEMTIQILERGQ
jgi:hypothetical protein